MIVDMNQISILGKFREGTVMVSEIECNDGVMQLEILS